MPFVFTSRVVQRFVWERRERVADILTELCLAAIALAVWRLLVLLVWAVRGNPF